MAVIVSYMVCVAREVKAVHFQVSMILVALARSPLRSLHYVQGSGLDTWDL